MLPDESPADTFRFTVQQVHTSFDYYVEAGDARSARYRVEVVKPPRVERVRLTYTLPAYAGEKQRTVDPSDGDIAGTRVDVQLKASKPLQTAVLKTRGGDKLSLAPRDDDRTWGVSFTLWGEGARLVPGIGGKLLKAPTTYQLLLRDTQGYDNREPLWRPITLVRRRTWCATSADSAPSRLACARRPSRGPRSWTRPACRQAASRRALT
jgi:hypothetical protein